MRTTFFLVPALAATSALAEGGLRGCTDITVTNGTTIEAICTHQDSRHISTVELWRCGLTDNIPSSITSGAGVSFRFGVGGARPAGFRRDNKEHGRQGSKCDSCDMTGSELMGELVCQCNNGDERTFRVDRVRVINGCLSCGEAVGNCPVVS